MCALINLEYCTAPLLTRKCIASRYLLQELLTHIWSSIAMDGAGPSSSLNVKDQQEQTASCVKIGVIILREHSQDTALHILVKEIMRSLTSVCKDVFLEAILQTKLRVTRAAWCSPSNLLQLLIYLFLCYRARGDQQPTSFRPPPATAHLTYVSTRVSCFIDQRGTSAGSGSQLTRHLVSRVDYVRGSDFDTNRRT